MSFSTQTTVNLPLPIAVFGDGASQEIIKGKRGHRVEPQSNRTVLLMRGRSPPERAFAERRPPERSARRQLLRELVREVSAETTAANTLILNFWAPELWENKLLLFKPSCLSYSVWQP